MSSWSTSGPNVAVGTQYPVTSSTAAWHVL
jgi:hypothetical protein